MSMSVRLLDLALALVIEVTAMITPALGAEPARIAPPPSARSAGPPGPSDDPGIAWTPPPEPALRPVPASPCVARPTAAQAVCLSDVAGTVPDSEATRTGEADAVATSDTAQVPLPPTAVPQAVTKTGSYSPADLASLYKIPANLTSNATIAIIDVGSDPNTAAQLGYYRSYFGLPPCTAANGCFREVNQSGGSSLPATNSEWVNEIALDVQAVSAICPTCHLLLVDAASTYASDLGAAALTAVRLGATYVSMSYGSADSAANTLLNLTYYNQTGVTYVAASGDNGYAGGTIFPSSAPNVIAVGGTSVQLLGGVWQQAAWSGSGSGCSSVNVLGVTSGLVQPRPASSYCAAGRGITDVAALADPSTGFMFYRAGQWWLGGGTSLAAPIITGLFALAGNHTNPFAIYQNRTAAPASFVDVTSGANGTCGTRQLCTSGAGWDGPTGIGTPSGLAGLVADGGTQVPLAAPHTAGQLTRSGGYPVPLRYQLLDALTGAPVPGAQVELRANTGPGYKTLATGTTDANGSFTYRAVPRVPTTYQVVFAGNVTATASTSNELRVASFSPKVTAKVTGSSIRVRARAPWGGPAAHLRLKLLRFGNHHWSTVRRATTSSAGTRTLKAPGAGRYRLTYGGGIWTGGRTRSLRVQGR